MFLINFVYAFVLQKLMLWFIWYDRRIERYTTMSQPGSGQNNTTWDFTDSFMPSQLLLTLNEQRQSGLFCDVIICIDGREFRCHRNVLSAFSPYFRAMFSSAMQEAKMDRIDIHEVDLPMFELLIDFAYSGRVTINEDNVKSLLATANFFEVLSVRDACCKYIGQHLNETNCISIFTVSDQHFCVNLRQKVKRFILANFEIVHIQPEFVSLGVDELVELLSDDQLCVTNEKDVFVALTSWFEHNKEDRREHFERAVDHVRFPLMSTAYLLCEVERYCTEIGSTRCRELIEEAKIYHILPDRRKMLENTIHRARPRLSNCELHICETSASTFNTWFVFERRIVLCWDCPISITELWYIVMWRSRQSVGLGIEKSRVRNSLVPSGSSLRQGN